MMAIPNGCLFRVEVHFEWMAISSVGSLTAVGWFTTVFEWMAIPSGWLFRVYGIDGWMSCYSFYVAAHFPLAPLTQSAKH
jgi:hypothetical protein